MGRPSFIPKPRRDLKRDYDRYQKCIIPECVRYAHGNSKYCYMCQVDKLELTAEEQEELRVALNDIACNNDKLIDYLMRQAPGVMESPDTRLRKAQERGVLPEEQEE